MTQWGNICRICSSPADYEIFAKIPTYLHGTTNEFLNWQKPINILLEETTGLKNSTDDGLPRNICAPCISYLKHAVTFREQCIKNALSLKLAALYQQKSVNISEKSQQDKESALFTAEDLRYVEQRPVHNLLLNNAVKLEGTKDKVHKQLLNQNVPQLSVNSEQRTQYLNLLYDKNQQCNAFQRKAKHSRDMELPTTSGNVNGNGNGVVEDEEDYAAVSSSDENEEAALLRKHKNCYNYSETNFEEDDPMEQDQLRDIKVTIPEPMWKERKCPACLKRFMFEDSHQTHLDNCVEYQFITFVTETTRLLEIRKQKMVSPHEFIRRMIFALHKTCTWLQEHSIDTLLAEKLNQVKVSNGEKTAAAPTVELEVKLDDMFDYVSGTTTPITAENNVLYAIARSESTNSQCKPKAIERTESTNSAITDSPRASLAGVKKPIPIRVKPANSSIGMGLRPSPQQSLRPSPPQPNGKKRREPLGLGLRPPAQQQPDGDKHKERVSFLEKLQRAAVTPGSGTPPAQAAPPSFSARCGQCNLPFDSVSDLEIHNSNYHNSQNENEPTINSDDDAQRRRIIALFEDDI
ncbi:uncharacterized protein LOC108163404 [Drosophila miranda]|uniref:uncharacterized protein LOC108163404 n=1 Tax=Drosophila miranda TaxID=7229 RepID=UPI0007E74F9A|nr:uncharacterized protein LOC108163404 [Drosophila miranda]